MKSFEELIRKPSKPLLKNLIPAVIITTKYMYSSEVCRYQERLSSIGDPVEKICRRILEKPECFGEAEYGGGLEWTKYYTYRVSYIKTIKDLTTGQIFVFDNHFCVQPTFLNEYEAYFLKKCVLEWQVWNEENKKSEECKVKDKQRQEMIKLYEDL